MMLLGNGGEREEEKEDKRQSRQWKQIACKVERMVLFNDVVCGLDGILSFAALIGFELCGIDRR